VAKVMDTGKVEKDPRNFVGDCRFRVLATCRMPHNDGTPQTQVKSATAKRYEKRCLYKTKNRV
jgi:hypothetical protein